MKFSAAGLLALAAAVMAQKNNTVVFTTITGTAYVTVCPVSSSINFSGFTYTNTYSTAKTVTVPCPGTCTQVVPVTTATSVVCKGCPTAVPVNNATVTVIPITSVPGQVAPATSTGASASGTTVPGGSKPYLAANGAERVAALGGAAALALAAYVL